MFSRSLIIGIVTHGLHVWPEEAGVAHPADVGHSLYTQVQLLLVGGGVVTAIEDANIANWLFVTKYKMGRVDS